MSFNSPYLGFLLESPVKETPLKRRRNLSIPLTWDFYLNPNANFAFFDHWVLFHYAFRYVFSIIVWM